MQAELKPKHQYKQLSNTAERNLALAGVFQAASIIQQLAFNGRTDNNKIKVLLNSLFNFNPESGLAVYNYQPEQLKSGINLLNEFVGGAKKTNALDKNTMRYIFSLIYLEKQLKNKNNILAKIKQKLTRLENQVIELGIDHDIVLANLANIYTDTLSQFKFRIQINGKQKYLTDRNITNKVRAVLLAGIRSAVLWRQLGGSRWQIVFGRYGIRTDCKLLLKFIN